MSSIPQPGAPMAPPQHVAIIMDGNRRWAKKRFMPVALGHAAGAKRLREVVEASALAGVKHLTVFAFSTENWRRPEDEVGALMRLFVEVLQREVAHLKKNNVRLRVIGDISRFDAKLQTLIAQAEADTAPCDALTLYVAANYGGRWDILQAAQRWMAAHPSALPSDLTEDALAPHLVAHDAPDVDLLIRTGGEQRISNFMLWQAAYAELYFSDKLWPEFKAEDVNAAIAWYHGRDRRFGSSAPL